MYAIQYKSSVLPLVPAGDEFSGRYVFNADCYGMDGEVVHAMLEGGRLQLNRYGQCPFWSGKARNGLVGEYLQEPESPYNPKSDVSVQVVNFNGEIAESHPLEDRLRVVGPICHGCDEFRGMKSRYIVDCAAKSCGRCGGVSINHICPMNKWDGYLALVGQMKAMHINPKTDPAVIDAILMGPRPQWPIGWWDWQNVKDAHKLHFDWFVANFKPNHYVNSRGIVIVGGGKYYASTYVTIRVLRMLGCSLPIQVWHLDEISPKEEGILRPYGVQCVNVLKQIKDGYLPKARSVGPWEIKTFAVLHSQFSEVMHIDADNYPERDPSFLFEEPAYKQHGAMFWPDQEGYDLKAETWKSFGLAPIDRACFESGQFLIDKSKWQIGLALADEIGQHSDWCFAERGERSWRFWGDKELCNISSRWLNLSYAMPSTRVRCIDVGMIQHDMQGNPLFIHRCRDKWTIDKEKGNGAFSVFKTTPQGTNADPAGRKINTFKTQVFDASLPHEQFCHDVLKELEGLLK